jgi:hypothetical protein
VAAVVVFIAGTMLALYQQPQLEAGEIESASIVMTGCMTCAVGGALLIIAFARYQFTHLWKSTRAIHYDKYKGHRSRRRSRK